MGKEKNAAGRKYRFYHFYPGLCLFWFRKNADCSKAFTGRGQRYDPEFGYGPYYFCLSCGKKRPYNWPEYVSYLCGTFSRSPPGRNIDTASGLVQPVLYQCHSRG